MTYKIKPIIIKAKTNLHVGDGSTNFDIVDKSVQRDSISNLPIINASSLKGALKDFMFDENLPKKSDDINTLEEEAFLKLFGSDDKQHGIIKFLDSYLLFLPLRSDVKPFFHTTSKANLLAFLEFYKDLGFEVKKYEEVKKVINSLGDDVLINCDDGIVEDYECKREDIKDIDIKLLLDIFPTDFNLQNIAILSDKNFIDAISHLPIIARNKVAKREDKKDSNLWYEEIVPRESIFYTAMLDYNNFGRSSAYKYEKGFDAFFNILQKEPIQVGANASVGFGLCSFKLLEEIQDEQ
jgi:CRISPR-associated protein Cmr4